MPVERTLFYLGKYAVRSAMKVAVRMDVSRQSDLPSGAKIFAVNHPTTSDPFLIASLFSGQTNVLVHETLFKVPVLGTYLRLAGHIPVTPGAGKIAFDRAIAALKKGRSIAVFIEGGLSPREGGFGRPKTGAVRMALLTGAPVIPVGVAVRHEDTYFLKTKIGAAVEEAVWLRGGPYAVTVGKPAYLKGGIADASRVRRATGVIMEEVKFLSRQSSMRIADRKAASLSLIQRLAGANALLRYTVMLHSALTFLMPRMKP